MHVLASQLLFLANRNAGLAISPLFWPVNCIKIGGHVALLSDPTVNYIYCAQGPSICKFFSFKCTTAPWSRKENVILTRGPFRQSLSNITAVISCNVDESKPDSHFESQIDQYFSCRLIQYIYSRRQHKC